MTPLSQSELAGDGGWPSFGLQLKGLPHPSRSSKGGNTTGPFFCKRGAGPALIFRELLLQNGCPTFRGVRKVGTTKRMRLFIRHSGAVLFNPEAESAQAHSEKPFDLGSSGAQPSKTTKTGAAD